MIFTGSGKMWNHHYWIVTNAATGELLPGATVSTDENNQEVATVTADESGKYNFEALAACDSDYIIRGKSDGCEYNESWSKPQIKNRNYYRSYAFGVWSLSAEHLGCRLSLQPIYFDFDRYNIRPDAEVNWPKFWQLWEAIRVGDSCWIAYRFARQWRVQPDPFR